MDVVKVIGSKTAKVIILMTGIPYAVAILINLIDGWPCSNPSESRFKALHPVRVVRLNRAILQQFTLVQYAPLFLEWSSFYKNASTVEKDVPFGSSNVTMDVWHPSNLSRQPSDISQSLLKRPLIIFVYGGAWGSGSKNMYCLLAQQLADKLNAVVVVPDYRIYPKGTMPDMVDDLINTIHTSRSLTCMSELSVDINQIVLVGHSAGAHLCSMTAIELVKRSENEKLQGKNMENSNIVAREEQSTLSADSRSCTEGQNYETKRSSKVIGEGTEKLMTEKEKSDVIETSGDYCKVDTEESKQNMLEDDVSSSSGKENVPLNFKEILSSIKGVIGIGGVYHIMDHYHHEAKRGVEDISPMWRAAKGLDNFELFSPTTLVHQLTQEQKQSLPPHLLVHGLQDTTVPATSSIKFSQVLAENEVPVDLKLLPQGGHADLALDLMRPGRVWYDPMMGIIMDACKKYLES